jgi:hypothetical protein
VTAAQHGITGCPSCKKVEGIAVDNLLHGMSTLCDASWTKRGEEEDDNDGDYLYRMRMRML